MFNFGSSPMSNTDLIQNIGLLSWINNEESGKDLCKAITTYRVGNELWQRISGEREIEQYRNLCIMAIVEYIQKNPRASDEDKAKEVTKQIQIFAARIESM